MRIGIDATDIEMVTTKPYIYGSDITDVNEKIPAVKTQVLFLKCNYIDALFFEFLGGNKIIQKKKQPVKGLGTYYKPILVSSTIKPKRWDKVLCDDRDHTGQDPKYAIRTVEKIENDWIYTKESFPVRRNPELIKLILALPEQFTEIQVQAMVSGEITNESPVLVECIFNATDDQYELKVQDGIVLYTHTIVHSQQGELIEDLYIRYEQFKVSRKVKKFYTLEEMKMAYQAGMNRVYEEIQHDLLSKDTRNTNKQRWTNRFVDEIQTGSLSYTRVPKIV
jgi:hypothetical protein